MTPPTFRPDLPREIDLIEEVLRLWGMGRVEATIPAAKNHIGGLTREQRLTRKVGRILRSCGLNETMNFSFAAPGDLERIGMTAEGRGCAVELMNPLGRRADRDAPLAHPGLLQSVEFNITHSTANVQLYEIGTLFFGRENASAPKEREAVAGVMSGSMGDVTWNYKPMPLRFFDGKGVVEELLEQLRIPKVRFRAAEGEGYAFLQPGRCAEVLSGGTVLGWVGEIHPDARDVYGIDIPVVAFELNLEALLKLSGTQEAYREFSQFPSVEHDLAIVVDDSVTCEDLERRLRLRRRQAPGGRAPVRRVPRCRARGRGQEVHGVRAHVPLRRPHAHERGSREGPLQAGYEGVQGNRRRGPLLSKVPQAPHLAPQSSGAAHKVCALLFRGDLGHLGNYWVLGRAPHLALQSLGRCA